MKIDYRIPTLAEYKYLRSSAGWWETDDAATIQALKNSMFSLVAIEDGKVIGCGRIGGDGGLYYYIQDLIIHPDYQNQGIGTSLMKELMGYIRANVKPGTFVALMAAKGLGNYYEQFGFKKREDDAPGMYQII